MAKSYLTTTEKKYLDFIKRKDEGFKQLNFDVGHIFKEELKDSIFYYFKKLLDLRHYDPDSISYVSFIWIVFINHLKIDYY